MRLPCQLKAIFHKYSNLYDTVLRPTKIPVPGDYNQQANDYTSDFATWLKEKFGLVLVFHASGDKLPYGYTIIDHAGKAVFKGSEIMPLKELLTVKPNKGMQEVSYERPARLTPAKTVANISYYASILKAALYNYPDPLQGLQHLGLAVTYTGGELVLADEKVDVCINCADLLNGQEYNFLVQQFLLEHELIPEIAGQDQLIPSVSISDDVDDEAVYGKNRRRKKETPTNSR